MDRRRRVNDSMLDVDDVRDAGSVVVHNEAISRSIVSSYVLSLMQSMRVCCVCGSASHERTTAHITVYCAIIHFS